MTKIKDWEESKTIDIGYENWHSSRYNFSIILCSTTNRDKKDAVRF